MSEATRCSTCGKIFGASWGDCSPECYDCRNGNSPREKAKRAKEQQDSLENEIKKLKKEIKAQKKRIEELETKYEPKYLGEGI